MFTITVNLTINPSQTKQAIEAAFDAAYRGERGDDESPEEFMLRKLEEHVLAIYQSRASNDAAAEASRNVLKNITEQAQIRQKKMKPEPQPDQDKPESTKTHKS